jgi:CubicO group peptidase (beta-lactamase class C family)
MRSSVNDMIRFVEANLGLRESTLATAMRATHETHADTQLPDLDMGLGWFLMNVSDTRLTWHSGGTSGFRSYVGLDLVGKRGVVVLSNSDNDVNNLGVHLLVPSIPLHVPSPPREFRPVRGRHPPPRRVRRNLQAQRRGSRFRAVPSRGRATLCDEPARNRESVLESDKTFYTEDQEDWGTFTRDSRGRVDGMTWFRENWQQQLKRIP